MLRALPADPLPVSSDLSGRFQCRRIAEDELLVGFERNSEFRNAMKELFVGGGRGVWV